MKFPFLASFIVFLLVLNHALRRRKKKDASTERTFWERERDANSVRRKSLDTLNYIRLPLDRFPMNLLPENTEALECQKQIEELSSQKIVNLTGFTNTDLKLEYGTANINVLSEYDQNYTLMVRTLQKWADVLLEAGYSREAQTLMEFAVDTETDISKTYYKLAEIYLARGDHYQIQQLVEKAEKLRSANKNTIVRTLQESYL